MKKVLIAFVALFAMGTMAMAQDAADLSFDENTLTLKVNKTDFGSLSKTDMQTLETISEGLKDVSFPTENGAISTITLNKQTKGDRVVGAILAIFLGDFGIHHFYTGDTKDGIWHLVFFWTGVPGLIGFIEGIIWLVDEGSFPQPLFGGIL